MVQRQLPIPAAVLFLAPPMLYIWGMGLTQGFGAPYMFRQLMGPGSNHSMIGLFLIFGSMLACPLLAVFHGIKLARQQRWRAAAVLIAGGVLTLTLGLLIRQPYSQINPSRADNAAPTAQLSSR